MRSFLAVTPDEGARGALVGLLADVRRALGEGAEALRWTPAENVHVTLHFLGDLDPGTDSRLGDALGERIAEPPFDAELATLGTFPAGGPPRVWWVAIGAGREPLARIHAELASRIERAGLTPEARPFAAHMTLARTRDRERRRARELARRLADVVVPPIRWRVDHVTLFHSDLSGPAPRYDEAHRIQLA